MAWRVSRGDTRGYDKVALAKRIRELRKAHGLTQEQLAEKTGIKLDTIREYERGSRQPYGGNRKALARELVDRKVASTDDEAVVILLEGVPEAGAAAASDEPDQRRELRDAVPRDDFLARVERICKLRRPGATIERRPSPEPFGAHLYLGTAEGAVVEVRIVAAVEHGVASETLDAFVDVIHARYREDASVLGFDLVYGGPPAAPEIVKRAAARRIVLKSFTEYQGLIDFRRYVATQTTKLAADRVYPPSLYVQQRAIVQVGRDEHRHDDAIAQVNELLASPNPRFVLVLADFGTGKTFLLHEVARRLGEQQGSLIPVLIEMRALEKARSLDALVAQHLAAAGMERIDLAAFRYMLEHGRIALLFDGFDELALRVTYERAAEHFDTLVEAARGNAKIVVSSRTQHFFSDQQIRTALAERADRIPGARTVRLQPFDDAQIRRFLVNRLGSEEAATRRFALLDEVKDLLGLSQNPRMLSFIAEVEEEKLVEAKKRDGEITSAGLYRLLLERWLDHEFERAHPKGIPPGLDRKQRWEAMTELAKRLWGKTEKTINILELPAELCAAVQALGPHSLDDGEVKTQIGSGTLLVRDEEGMFSFIHQSVLEWLVANAAAKEVKLGGTSAALGAGEMSDLMADFFWALAGRDAAVEWADTEIGGAFGETAAKNALRVQKRLGIEANRPIDLAGKDLRGQDFSGRDLRRANLRGVDLRDAKMVGANLEGAVLAEARLARTDLSKASLAGADLARADLTSARLLGTDLRGAKLENARHRNAALLCAKLDAGMPAGGEDFGAAPPSGGRLDAVTASAESACLAVCMSPDSSLVASGHTDGTVRLWDASTGAELRILRAHEDHVRSIAFSPDGHTLTSASDDTTVRLWDPSTGAVLRVLQGHEAGVRSIGFSPDGHALASASVDKTVRLWNPNTGDEIRIFQGHNASVVSVAFSPDGLTLASASVDKTLRLWNPNTGDEVRLLRGHGTGFKGIAFSPDGDTLASGSSDGTVCLWSASTGAKLRVLHGHKASVRSVAFSPDGHTLTSASDDTTVRLWDPSTGAVLRILQGHGAGVGGVAFSPDGHALASASHDRTMRLWDPSTGAVLRILQGHMASVVSVAISPDGDTLVSASVDKTVSFWDPSTGAKLRALQSNDTYIRRVAFSPDGHILATASGDRIVRLWDPSTGAVLSLLEGHEDSVRGISFSPDGHTLASASDDRTVRLWDTSTRTKLRILQGHEASVRSISFAPDGRTLASASYDKTVRLWGASKGDELRILRAHEGHVRSVAFSPDGHTLASASDDTTVRLWDPSTGSVLRIFEGHEAGVRSIGFSPDGHTLASASVDKTVRLWDPNTGAELWVFQSHNASVVSVAFSPDGLILASASVDGTIRLWAVATGTHLATLLPRPEGWAALLPDGRYKLGGDIAGAFWHVIGLVRFEPGELDPYIPGLRIPDDEPLLAPRAPLVLP